MDVVKRGVAISLAVFMASLTHADPEPLVDAQHAERMSAAQAAVGTFAHQLKTELSTAMSEAGPVAAIEVCQERAPAIAKALSATTGFTLSRVSLKPRNPIMGPATDWQTDVLTDFASRAAQGEDPARLVWHHSNEGEFRMMKAIPTAWPASVGAGCSGAG